MRKIYSYILLASVAVLCLFPSCRGDEYEVIWAESQAVTEGRVTQIYKGFFLLNEGNMGSNKASLDYFDYESGMYYRDIFPTLNPTITHNLGDVGNDIKVYGNKLYAVINCSHLVEVMDLETGKHQSTISITNCRYIVFKDGYAYVSSYNGPVQIDPNSPLGTVVKVDTTDMKVVGMCTVGYQPEEMVVDGDKLYVANSGGYRVPNYDHTVSVIDLKTFTETKKIDVGINLHRMKMDGNGLLYVSSRGDYKNIGSKTFVIDTSTDEVVKTLDLPNSNMALADDRLYIYSVEWSHLTASNTVSYAVYNTDSQEVETRNFITDGTEKHIKVPYGIAVNTETDEIFTTDAKDYVTPGTLYCFDQQTGRKKWSVVTGDIPAHIAFTPHRLKTLHLLEKNIR